MVFDELSNKIIGLAIKVHKNLGPGLLEKTYQKCLEYEILKAGIPVQCELLVPVIYESVNIDCGFRIDMLVDNSLILELKNVESLQPIHISQIMTYLKLTGKKTGLLINFNSAILKEGIKRVVM